MKVFAFVACLLLVSCAGLERGRASSSPQQATRDTPTLRVTSTLVFLDVTVLDKKGHPVTSGLTRDDFTITEDKKPENIFSFEPPQEHVLARNANVDNPDGKAPVTILVLDLLNSTFQDFAYIRWSVRRFLLAQPERLAAPAEMLVVGDESLEMLQGYTRSRADLLNALNHLPAAYPFKRMNASFFWERFAQSFDALQQIALQNKGIPGRKNIIWVGHGGPSLVLNPVLIPPKAAAELNAYTHSTVNMLVDSRISLFVIYPGLPIYGDDMSYSAMISTVQVGDNDPFSGDISFGLLVNESGGRLFFNRNDVDAEIAQSQQMGANYYTLTYQPHDEKEDGKFRRVRVTLRDPNLKAVTKIGYFAPDAKAPVNLRQERMTKIAEAVTSTIPFDGLDLQLSGLTRHPDSQTVEFTVNLASKNVSLERDETTGGGLTTLVLGAASLDPVRNILASKVETLRLTSTNPDPAKLPAVVSRVPVSLRLPRRTRSIRVVMEDTDGGRMGTAILDRKALDAAPATPTPEPAFTPQPGGKTPPAPKP